MAPEQELNTNVNKAQTVKAITIRFISLKMLKKVILSEVKIIKIFLFKNSFRKQLTFFLSEKFMMSTYSDFNPVKQ